MSELLELDQFKKERKDLHDIWNKMSKEQLLDAIWKEALDAVNMEIRVSVFMEHCTQNMSKTGYTPDSLVMLINSRKEQDLKDWCSMIVEDAKESDNYNKHIIREVEELAPEGSWSLD